MVSHSKPDNIDKLRLVPAFAVRQLLQQKDSDRGGRYENMSQDRMVKEAENVPSITASDIETLYENYRYGGKVSFFIYLIPENAEVVSADQIAERLDALDVNEEDEEGQSTISQVKILDHPSFDELTEFRYTYLLKKHYLNELDETASYVERRYGFIWVDFVHLYIAILAKEERLNHLLIDQITGLIGARPLSVVLPKDLINQTFHFEDLQGASHYDPITGTKQRIAWPPRSPNPENIGVVKQRDQAQRRSNSLYQEHIAGDTSSGLGVTAEKGKVYLLKTLPTSALRQWGRRRLPELVAGLREIQHTNAHVFLQTLQSNFQFKGVGQPGKQLALDLMERILTCRQQGVSSVPLNIPIKQLIDHMRRSFFIQFEPYCEQCANNAETVCPHCESSSLVPNSEGLICENCKTFFDYEQSLSIKCNEGHTIHLTEILSSLTLSPKKAFLEILAGEINKVETRLFDHDCEWFCIHGSMLDYLHQDKSVRFQLEDLGNFPSLPLLPPSDSGEYKELRIEIRNLKEKCQPAISIELCQSCVENREERLCLMKLFHNCIAEYTPQPHHGNEFGDVNFPTELFGRETYFRGLLKKYESGEISIRHSLGRDILTQVITQDARDRIDTALAIVTATKLSPQLETELERQVRYYQGKVSIVKEQQLMRVLKKYKQDNF